jgi:hypothetical protein
MLQLELGQQAGEPIVLQLIAQRAVEVARERAATGYRARLGQELLIDRERNLCHAHVHNPTPSRIRGQVGRLTEVPTAGYGWKERTASMTRDWSASERS